MMSFTPFVLLVCLVGLAAAGVPQETDIGNEVIEESNEVIEEKPKPKLEDAVHEVHDVRDKLKAGLNKLQEEEDKGGLVNDLLLNHEGILKEFKALEDELKHVGNAILDEYEEEPDEICEHLVEVVHAEGEKPTKEEIDNAVKDDIDCFFRQAGHLSDKFDELFNGDDEEVEHIDIVLLNNRLRGLIGDFNAMIRALPKPKEGDKPGPEADQQGQLGDTGPLEKRLLELLLEKRLKKTDKPSQKRSYRGF